jgi:putative peptide zinc metalloprotease protein
MNPALLTAVTDRPLRLRWRGDLQVHCQRYQQRDSWIVKDPLRLKYFRFEEEELWLLRQLDGLLSLDDLQRRFQRQFSPQQVSARDIHRLIGRAHQSGLLLADEAGQGEVLFRRRRESQRRRLWMFPTELLSLRLRGFDPDRLLTRLNQYVGWLFAWPAAALCLLAVTLAAISIATHWDEFCLRLPASTEFFGPSNWIYLAATLAAVKILHELGHGVACKRFGGECHEMGVMFLCFTPCLYCDVTDSWMIPSKWRRAAVGAAGMYIELWLAAAATLIWWQTQPGIVHYLALNVMFIGSVSTLVFNANPLMRYDGYYILADLVEIPNLRLKAEAVLQHGMSRWLWGTRPPVDRFIPQRWQNYLAAYAIASAVYRWFVAAALVWFFYTLTEPLGFKIVGQVLALAAIIGLIAGPVYLLTRYLQAAWLWERTDMNQSRALLRLSMLGGTLLMLFCLPLPYYVRGGFRLAPEEAAAVYVDVPGQIQEILVQSGNRVEAGQPLLKLRNLDLELAAAQLQTQVDAQAAKVTALRQRSLADESARGEVAQAEQSLAKLKEQLTQRQEQLGKLAILAPRSGVVMTAPRRPRDQQEDVLPAWHGHLLEDRNRGATVAPSDLVCLIGDPTKWEAILAIDGRDVDFVQPGQRVDLLPAQRPGRRIASQVAAVSQRELKSMPAALSTRGGGELPTTTSNDGRERPTSVTYEASASFVDASALLANGGSGVARIHAGYQTPAARLWRELRRTFHFEM